MNLNLVEIIERFALDGDESYFSLHRSFPWATPMYNSLGHSSNTYARGRFAWWHQKLKVGYSVTTPNPDTRFTNSHVTLLLNGSVIDVLPVVEEPILMLLNDRTGIAVASVMILKLDLSGIGGRVLSYNETHFNK